MEDVINLKNQQRKHIQEQLSAVQRRANEFKSSKDIFEKSYTDFFEDIKKHSNKFTLKLTPKTEEFDVRAFTVGSDGNFSYNNWTVVDTITVNYNDCVIVYNGEMPPNTPNYHIPKIHINEHIVYTKRGFGSTNHGYKMQVETHILSKGFYKTGKKVVQLVEDFVGEKWSQHNHRLERIEVRDLAYKKLKETYKFCIIDYSNDNEYVVRNLNGTQVTLSYCKNSDNEIVFNVKKVTVKPSHDIKNLIESLGKL